MRWIVLSAASLLFLSGCAHIFSERAETLVDPAITFEQVRKEPQAFAGKYLKVGGIIVDTKNTKEGTQIEVVQFGLGRSDFPDEEYGSAGRFLATTSSYLDSMIFKSGRPVALIGEIQGEKTLPLGEISYRYPVVSIAEIHVWKRSELQPYYPPYYDLFYYDRFYYDRFYYPYRWYGPPYGYWYGPRRR